MIRHAILIFFFQVSELTENFHNSNEIVGKKNKDMDNSNPNTSNFYIKKTDKVTS